MEREENVQELKYDENNFQKSNNLDLQQFDQKETNDEDEEFNENDENNNDNNSEQDEAEEQKQEEQLKEIKIDPKIQSDISNRESKLRQECLKQKSSINLSNSEIDDLDCVSLSLFFLEKRSQIKLLHLGSNCISDDGLISILQSIQWHSSTLQELYLGNNKFTELGLNAFIEIMPVFSNLKILSLYQTNMTDSNMINFSLQASQLANLKQLFLNNNSIEDEGILCFTTVLSSNDMNLSVLHLGNNEITSVGIKQLLQQIYFNDKLKILYLNNIVFDNECMKFLNYFLLKNKYLQELNLSYCNIKLEQLKIIEPGLRANKSLKALHLLGNPFNDQCIGLFLEILDHDNSCISQITVSKDGIDNLDLMDELSEYLKQNANFANPQNSILNIIEKFNTKELQAKFENEVNQQFEEELKKEERKQNKIMEGQQKNKQIEKLDQIQEKIEEQTQEISDQEGKNNQKIEDEEKQNQEQKNQNGDESDNQIESEDNDDDDDDEEEKGQKVEHQEKEEEEEEQAENYNDDDDDQDENDEIDLNQEDNGENDEKQLDELQNIYDGIQESMLILEKQQNEKEELDQDEDNEKKQEPQKDQKKETQSKSKKEQVNNNSNSQNKQKNKSNLNKEKQQVRPQSAQITKQKSNQNKKQGDEKTKFKEHNWQGYEKDKQVDSIFHSKYK